MSQGYTKGTPIDTDPTLSANSNLVTPSQAAVVSYVASQIPLAGVTAVSGAAPINVTPGPTPTVSMPVASAVQSGYLNNTDWNTFNNKQNALTNPITGTGTANEIAYFTGSTTLGSLTTATYPSLTELSYVKGITSGIQTQLNGKEPTLTKGNLTESTSSVLTITGGSNAVIGSGTTIEVKQASGSQSGFLSSTDWTTFNSKQGALTLTTTGTSGAATLIGNTLNIPQYSGGGVTSIGTINSGGLSTNGATIVGSTLYMQTATTLVPGLVSTGTQTFAGQKTFNGKVDISAGTTTSPFTVTSTATNSALAAITVTSNSGSIGQIVTTNGIIQYSARTSGFTDRQIRILLDVGGSAYIQNHTSTGTVSADLRLGATHSAGSNTGSVYIMNGGLERIRVTGTGILIGEIATLGTPTAKIHITPAQTTSASTAPLKFTAGSSLMTTAETGAFEYNTTNLYFTRTGTTRESVFTGVSGAAAPTAAAGTAFTQYYGSAASPILGTPNSWASVVINGTTYKIPLYT